MRGSRSTRRVAAVAARQHGNVSHDQLLAAGLAPWQIAKRLETGWLIPRHTRVYAVGHAPRTREARWHAAVLALGGEAVLSHRAAAALWGLVRGPVPAEVLVPPGAGHRPRDGVIVHRSIVPDDHITTRHGIPVTTVLRALLDAAAVMPLRQLGRAFEEAQVQHAFAPAPLAAEVPRRSAPSSSCASSSSARPTASGARSSTSPSGHGPPTSAGRRSA